MNGAFTTLKNKTISNSGRGTKDIKHLYYSDGKSYLAEE